MSALFVFISIFDFRFRFQCGHAVKSHILAISHWGGLGKSWPRPIKSSAKSWRRPTNHDHHKIIQTCNLRRTRTQPPRAYHYTSRMMPCAHGKVDVSQHRTTPRPGIKITVDEEAAPVSFGGWLPARKQTQNVQTSGRATTTAVPASVHNNYRSWDFNCCCGS